MDNDIKNRDFDECLGCRLSDKERAYKIKKARELFRDPLSGYDGSLLRVHVIQLPQCLHTKLTKVRENWERLFIIKEFKSYRSGLSALQKFLTSRNQPMYLS